VGPTGHLAMQNEWNVYMDAYMNACLNILWIHLCMHVRLCERVDYCDYSIAYKFHSYTVRNISLWEDLHMHVV